MSYTQAYQGVPVFGSMVKANIDKDGDLTAVNGFAAPGIDVSTKPTFSATEIGKRAVLAVQSDPPSEDSGAKADTSGLATGGAQLVIYRTGFVKGETGESILAWAVRVGNGAIEDQLIYDAHTGKIVNRYSLGADALERELREASGTPQAPTFETVWEEGDPFPGDLNIDQQNLVNSSGESYWFFETAFGRDSYDGDGRQADHGQQRPADQLPQRQLERLDHQLLRRRHVRRRRVARVGPRLHRVHQRADLPVPVRCAQRVVLRRVGRVPRPDQRSRGRGRDLRRQASRR